MRPAWLSPMLDTSSGIAPDSTRQDQAPFV